MRPLRVLIALLALAVVAAACADEAAEETADEHDETEEEHDDHDEDDHDEDDHDHDHDEEGDHTGGEEVPDPEPRLVVGDAEDAVVHVVDLTTEETLATLDIDDADPILAAPVYGQVAAVTQPDADATHLVDSGTWGFDHGDHGHYYVAEPRVLDTLDLGRPIHTSHAYGLITVFADDEGASHVVEEAELLDRGHAHTELIDSGTPHHGGNIATSEDLIVVSEPEPDQDGGLPDAVAVHLDGEQVGVHDCPGLHGEVAVAGGAAFACADRVLALEAHGDHADETVIDYPDEIERVGYLAGHPEHTNVAAARDDLLMIVDTAAGDVVDVVELPAEAASRAHVDDDGTLLVVTDDGTVHQFDLETGAHVASSEEAVTVEDDEDAPSPSIAGGRDRAYVSSPADGAILEFATNDDLRLARTIDVGGNPTGLAYFGAMW